MLHTAQLPIIERDETGAPQFAGFRGDPVVVPDNELQPFIDAKFVVKKLQTPLPNANGIRFPTPLRIAQDAKELEKFNITEATQRQKAKAKQTPAQLTELERLKVETAELEKELAFHKLEAAKAKR